MLFLVVSSDNFYSVNDCLVGLQRCSEGKLYSSTSLFSNYCISYRSHPASRQNIELIQELDGDFFVAQANVAELTEVPNQDSEEPKASDPIDATKDKPRCIILLF